MALVPDDPEAHRVRISALMDLKRYDEVLASADAYLARGKPVAEILEIRGVAREARRDHAGAIADFHRALELSAGAEPDQRSRLLNRRGWAYHYADAPRLALADFEESLRLNPNQAEAYGGRGLARIRLGEWRLAVADAEAGLRQKPRAGADATAEGDREPRIQSLFNAARIYAQAIEFAAQDVTRQGERAVVLYRKYRSRALELLEEALMQVPDRVAAKRSSMTPPCDRSGSHLAEASECARRRYSSSPRILRSRSANPPEPPLRKGGTKRVPRFRS